MRELVALTPTLQWLAEDATYDAHSVSRKVQRSHQCLDSRIVGQAKTYFLLSGDQFRPPEFLAALAEVRQIPDTRTAAARPHREVPGRQPAGIL